MFGSTVCAQDIPTQPSTRCMCKLSAVKKENTVRGISFLNNWGLTIRVRSWAHQWICRRIVAGFCCTNRWAWFKDYERGSSGVAIPQSHGIINAYIVLYRYKVCNHTFKSQSFSCDRRDHTLQDIVFYSMIWLNAWTCPLPFTICGLVDPPVTMHGNPLAGLCPCRLPPAHWGTLEIH